jgi:uncharacterized membrane protein YoaK (UPF0700 family)
MLSHGIALAAFAFGAFLAILLIVRWLQAQNWRPELRMGLALEFPFVAMFGALCVYAPLLPRTSAIAAPIFAGACAMGIQSIAVRNLRISGVVTTFITGTIITAILELLTGPEDKSRHRGSPGLLVLILIAYLAAAASAAVLSRNHIVIAALIPTVIIAGVWLRLTFSPSGPR